MWATASAARLGRRVARFRATEDEALARGISQGESNALMNEYNSLSGLQQGATGQLGGLYNSLAGQQQNAANSTGGLLASLFGAGNTTAKTIADLATNENQNWLSALGAANALPGLYTQGPSAQLQALATQMGIPVQNLQNTLGSAVVHRRPWRRGHRHRHEHNHVIAAVAQHAAWCACARGRRLWRLQVGSTSEREYQASRRAV